MALFATFMLAPYREGDQHRATTFAAFREASSELDAKKQTMGRLAETRPDRQYGQPKAVSVEVPAWQLRQAQEPGKALYMVGITTSSLMPGFGDVTSPRVQVVVASSQESAQRQASDQVRRQHPNDRQVDALTVVASPDLVQRARQEWDRQRGNHQEPTQQTAQVSKAASMLNVKEFAQKVIDTYRDNMKQTSDMAKAQYSAIYTHAKQVADQGLATLRDASRVGNATIKSYDDARARGTDHLVARQQAAQTVAQRYDDQGRDTQRQERQRSYSMSR